MQRIKLSIVVPIYNMNKFLGSCLRSLLNQNIAQDLYEIICVNDGSTDNSKEICVEYLEQNNNIHYFEQSNKGLSSARNLGISKSNGDYIWFVDADDEIQKNCLATLLNEIYTNNLDILELKFKSVKVDYVNDNEAIDFQFEKINMFESHTACSKIVRKRILIDDHVFFIEEISNFEDYLWCIELKKHISSCEKCLNQIYFYRQNPSSITREPETREKTIYNYFKLIALIKNKQVTLDEADRHNTIKYMVWEIFNSSFLVSEKQFLIELLKQDKLYPYEVIENTCIPDLEYQKIIQKYIMYTKVIISNCLLKLFVNEKILKVTFKLRNSLCRVNPTQNTLKYFYRIREFYDEE